MLVRVLRCERSIPCADDVRALVEDSYGLQVTACALRRSLTNDVYAVHTVGGRYALKLYRSIARPGARTLDEIAWEQDLALAASATGVTAAKPYPLRAGDFVGVTVAPEGDRPYVLTTWAAGVKPQPPFTDALYHRFGAVTATFHQAAAAMTSAHERRGFDLTSDLDRPLAEVVECLEPSDRVLARELAKQAHVQLAALAAEDLSWGVCHGDISLDNVHVVTGVDPVAGHCAGPDLTLHDFDLAAPGWLAADLTGVHATEHWPAFLDGYTGVRPLPSTDLAALPWFTVVGLIANLRFHLVDKVRLRGTESRRDGWVDRELTALRSLAASL